MSYYAEANTTVPCGIWNTCRRRSKIGEAESNCLKVFGHPARVKPDACNFREELDTISAEEPNRAYELSCEYLPAPTFEDRRKLLMNLSYHEVKFYGRHIARDASKVPLETCGKARGRMDNIHIDPQDLRRK